MAAAAEAAGGVGVSEDRLGFETLVSDISAHLIAVPPGRVEGEVLRSLDMVREFFRADRIGLLRVQGDRGRVFVSHAAYAPGLEPVPGDLNLAELFPAVYRRLMAGEVVAIPRTADLPPPDRDNYLRMGTLSTLDVPIRIEGAIPYFLALNFLREERRLPEEWFPRVLLLGQVLVNAMERRRWEVLLRESEEQRRVAAEAAQVGLWSMDLDGERFWASEAARRLFSFSPGEELTLEGVLGRIHPEDRGRVRLAVEAARQRGTTEQVEYRVDHPDGDTRWLLSRGSAVRTMSGARLVGVSSDVTDRRQAEAALRDNLEVMTAAAEAGRLGFYEVRWDEGALLVPGAGIREVTGLPAEEEHRALEWLVSRIHPEDREHVLGRRRLLEEGAQAAFAECRYQHPDRGELWFRIAGRVLERGAAGRLVRSVTVVSDVTDLKRVEDDLRRSLEEVRSLRDEYQQQNVVLREQIRQEGGRRAIVGESDPMLRVLEAVRRVAPTDATVLITGETGTGKELLAEAIHQESRRRDRPLLRVNCAALPSTLIESELFGRERGAYTGAMTMQAGRFEQAHGGTLFLDEISELSLEVQPKLLRVLQDGQFERLGGASTRKVDVRVIAATNRDLASFVEQGRFRPDLFYRLSVFPIEAPPLRDRGDDIPLLVWHFLRHFARKMGKPIDTIPRQTLERLQGRAWPGNVRELRNLIERSVILSDSRVLTVEFPSDPSSGDPEATTLEEVERRHILRTLERSGWRIRGAGGAAERLGLNPTTLHSRLKKLRISRPRA